MFTCLLLALVLSLPPDQYDTVVLTNGGILRGSVVKDVPGESLILELTTGEIWTIPRAEIARIEPARVAPPDGGGPEESTAEPAPKRAPETAPLYSFSLQRRNQNKQTDKQHREKQSQYFVSPFILFTRIVLPPDPFNNPVNNRIHTGAVIPPPKIIRHRRIPAHQSPAFQVGQLRFQSITDFNSRLLVIYGDKKENPVILLFLSYTPLLENIVGKILEGAVFKGRNYKYSDFIPGAVAIPENFRLEFPRLVSVKDPRQVIDRSAVIAEFIGGRQTGRHYEYQKS